MKKTIKSKNNRANHLNFMLLSLALILVSFYVLAANSIASKSYLIRELRSQMGVALEEQSDLMTQKINLENPLVLVEAARLRNLVEAKNISYIFESKDVAQR